MCCFIPADAELCSAFLHHLFDHVNRMLTELVASLEVCCAACCHCVPRLVECCAPKESQRVKAFERNILPGVGWLYVHPCAAAAACLHCSSTAG